MKEFYREFIKEEYGRFRLLVDEQVIEEQNKINTILYEDRDGMETITIRDIIQEKYDKPQAPVVFLNFENELGFGGYEDKLINCILEQGTRIVFVKCSYYETQDNQEGYFSQGINYWKRNMAALQLCYEYLISKGYTEDLSFVAMNGLTSCSLALMNGNEISCNRLFLINGCMDFEYIYENHLWDQIFTFGYYHYAKDSKKNPLQDNPELSNFNPYRLLCKAKAEEKVYFDNHPLFQTDDLHPIAYASLDEILQRIMEEI